MLELFSLESLRSGLGFCIALLQPTTQRDQPAQLQIAALVCAITTSQFIVRLSSSSVTFSPHTRSEATPRSSPTCAGNRLNQLQARPGQPSPAQVILQDIPSSHSLISAHTETEYLLSSTVRDGSHRVASYRIASNRITSTLLAHGRQDRHLSALYLPLSQSQPPVNGSSHYSHTYTYDQDVSSQQRRPDGDNVTCAIF